MMRHVNSDNGSNTRSSNCFKQCIYIYIYIKYAYSVCVCVYVYARACVCVYINIYVYKMKGPKRDSSRFVKKAKRAA